MNMLPEAIRNLLQETMKKSGIYPNKQVNSLNSYVVENVSFRIVGSNINFNFEIVVLLPIETKYEKIESLILNVALSFGNAEGNNIDDTENSRKLLVFRVSQTCNITGA